MMGEVCDELVLVTRSDRAVVIGEYGGGSCLYFLAREVAYFWALKVTLWGIQLGLSGDWTPNVAGIGGAFARKVWHQSTKCRVQSSPL